MVIMKRKVLRQIRILLPAFLFDFINGMQYAWFAGSEKYFHEDANGIIPMTEEQLNFTACLLHSGRFLAPFFCIVTSTYFGRKSLYLISLTVEVGGSVLQTFTKSVPLLQLARLITGFGLGVGDVSSNVYVGEISSKTLRGRFCATLFALWYLGNAFEYALDAYVSYTISSIIRLALCSLNLILWVTTVESPYFLVTRDRDKALETVAWLQDLDTEQAEMELALISENEENAVNFCEFLKLFKKPEVYKSFGIASFLAIITSMLSVTVGSNATLIIPKTKTISSSEFAIILGVLTTIAAFVPNILVNRFGRKPLLVWTFTVETISCGAVAVLFFSRQTGLLNSEYLSWIILGLVTFTLDIYLLGGMVPNAILRTELFPQNMRIFGISSCVVIKSTANFVFTFFFLKISQSIGMYLNFLIFSISSIIAGIVVYYLVPETKDKTLYEIQKMLKET